MQFYRCDWCKKESKKIKHLKITGGLLRPRPVFVDLCEECFNILFAEQIIEWKKEDEEKRKRIEERKAQIMEQK